MCRSACPASLAVSSSCPASRISDAGAGNHSVAGPISIDSSRSMVRCVSTSKLRIDSTSEPKNSMRTGASAAGG